MVDGIHLQMGFLVAMWWMGFLCRWDFSRVADIAGLGLWRMGYPCGCISRRTKRCGIGFLTGMVDGIHLQMGFLVAMWWMGFLCG